MKKKEIMKSRTFIVLMNWSKACKIFPKEVDTSVINICEDMMRWNTIVLQKVIPVFIYLKKMNESKKCFLLLINLFIYLLLNVVTAIDETFVSYPKASLLISPLKASTAKSTVNTVRIHHHFEEVVPIRNLWFS